MSDNELDKLLAKLAQDRDVLLDALKALVKATHDADNPEDMGLFGHSKEVKQAEAVIAQAEAHQ